jgi:hypothetical protein
LAQETTGFQGRATSARLDGLYVDFSECVHISECQLRAVCCARQHLRKIAFGLAETLNLLDSGKKYSSRPFLVE